MARYITGNQLLKVLQQRGLVNQDTRSVVIDIDAGHLPTMTIRHYISTELAMALTDQLDVTDNPERPKITPLKCECGHEIDNHRVRAGFCDNCSCDKFDSIAMATKENSND